MSTPVPQVAKIVSMDVSKAYEELKKLLRESRCRVIEEGSPNKIVVEHGSVFAYSPMNAEKVATFILTPVDSKTRIVATTQLTSDYKQFIILSNVFGFLALILYGVMFRIVDALIDLTKRLAGHVPPDIEAMVEMVNVLLFITIAMIVIGIIWDIYVYWKRNSFAENILKLLP